MFTIEEIKAAHSRVKSGADFPQYIRDLRKLGVVSYETYVIDGHTDYYGENDHTCSSPSSYENLNIATESNTEEFVSDLKSHQAGNTDYMTFCSDCAKSGIEKWVVSIPELTCAYYDMNGKEVLLENIPE